MRRSALVSTLACPLILGLTACASGTGSTAASPAAPTASPSPTAEKTVEFEYDGDRGPDYWSTLSADFAQCADSTTQSPIDLAGASAGSLPDPEFEYAAGAVELTNTTHTVLATEGAGSSLVLDGRTSDLVQFHMHEPSEHTVNGVRYDAEVHLVHTDDTGAITVVAILFAAGAENPALAPYIDALPDGAGATTDLTGFDPSALLPVGSSTFRYTGSLTTPPCTEGVTWVVLEQPAEISPSQLAAFRSVIDQNDRPVQDLGTRTLTLDSADS